MENLNQGWLHHFRSRKGQIMDFNKYHRFALFVPLMKINGEYHMIFEVRAENIRQPGEICFPGGKVDSTDPSHEAAAIRELSEELGVTPSKVEIIGELDYMITPYKLILYPFLGIIEEDANISKNDGEVREVLYVPLSELLIMEPMEHHIYLKVEPEKEFPYHLIPNGEDYNWRTGSVKELFYEYNNYVIWGITARILAHVIEEMKQFIEN
ncbi:8-oxo-dGTP pyrophosphatase MutT (NUDIX family) [Evansella vedderi]|uniref:8-oxo-dGTP pyrophosphatase MutT (NUDIX family) n=1 Tax=Evansella vedderi TaxID=38282 RepID=A0ABT9ZST2_9BACI|nr:CoA pyrophosphatase [Evansella vedderi]MDQ0254296.1 8-oxo-dGTP pyrophosphatase MutT (NUDIX family) [Evansella vedderi]